MFSRDLWNVSARIEQDLPRTTNGLEGWHSGLSTSIRIDHPNVWILINQLKGETVGTLMAVANSQANPSAEIKVDRQREKDYARLTKTIQSALDQLNRSELAIMPFLRSIALNKNFTLND